MINKTLSIPTMSKQSGNAAIMFVLLFPILFGLFILASDGARALQSKARLDDALEVASLAISAKGTPDKSIAKAIAKAYVAQYMTDMVPTGESAPKIDVILTTDNNSEKFPFIQYQLSATTTHNSWFPGNDAIKGFGETFTVSGRSFARKYQSEAVDVVFAADFSGSMNEGWSGGSQRKYLDLLDIIDDVTIKLDSFNANSAIKNTVAFTAFNTNTKKDNSPSNNKKWCDEKYDYESKTYDAVHYYDQYNTYKPFDILHFFPKPRYINIDYNKTKQNIFKPKTCNDTVSSTYVGKNSKFHDVEPTDNFEDFRIIISKFKPDGGTASYQGIIRAAQLAQQGQNARRLIIILSDGQDMPSSGRHNHKKITEKLVSQGMCNDIRNKLQSGNSGKNVVAADAAKIFFIGFDYDTENNIGLRDCAGAENVYKAQNKSEILNKILALISEEIGHLS
jgi:tight adherence protein G